MATVTRRPANTPSTTKTAAARPKPKPAPVQKQTPICARPDDSYWLIDEQRVWDPKRDPATDVPTHKTPGQRDEDRPKVPDRLAYRFIPYAFKYALAGSGNAAEMEGQVRAQAALLGIELKSYDPTQWLTGLEQFLSIITDPHERALFHMLSNNGNMWAIHVSRVARGFEPIATPQTVPEYVKHWLFDRLNTGPLDATGKPLVPPCYGLVTADGAPLDWSAATVMQIMTAEPVGLPVDAPGVIAMMDPALRAKAAAVVPDWKIIAEPFTPEHRRAVVRGARAVSIRKLLADHKVV